MSGNLGSQYRVAAGLQELGEIADALESLDLEEHSSVRALILDAHSILERYALLEAGKVPASVAIVGSFNCGKSSFINRILGEDICPVDACPTTSSITRFRFCDGLRIVMTRGSSRGRATRRPIPVERYKRLVTHAGRSSTKAGGPLRFDYEGPFSLLRRVDLIDTPGFENLKNPHDQSITEAEMRQADVIFYLVDINQGSSPSPTGLDVLGAIRSDAPDAPIYLVMNKADTKVPSANERILQDARRKYSDLFRKTILFCSKPGVNVPGTSSARDMLDIFDEILKDKLAVQGGGVRNLERLHLMKRNEQLSWLERRLGQVVDASEQALGTNRRIREGIGKWSTSLKRSLPGEFSDVVGEVAEGSLETLEIEGSAEWYEWNDDARVRLDAAKALAIFNKATVWQEFRAALSNSLLESLHPAERKVARKTWSRIIADARRQSYRAFIGAFREDMKEKLCDKYDRLGEADDDLEEYLEDLRESPRDLAKAAAGPVRAAVQEMADYLDTALDDMQSATADWRKHVQAEAQRVSAVRKLEV